MFEERAVSGKRGKSRAGSYWRSGEICPPYAEKLQCSQEECAIRRCLWPGAGSLSRHTQSVCTHVFKSLCALSAAVWAGVGGLGGWCGLCACVWAPVARRPSPVAVCAWCGGGVTVVTVCVCLWSGLCYSAICYG